MAALADQMAIAPMMREGFEMFMEAVILAPPEMLKAKAKGVVEQRRGRGPDRPAGRTIRLMADAEDVELTMAVGQWVTTTAHKAMADGMDEEHAVHFAVGLLPEVLDKAACVITALALKEEN